MPKLWQFRGDNDSVPYEEWESSLPGVTAARITKYVKRMEKGNFGNSKIYKKRKQEEIKQN